MKKKCENKEGIITQILSFIFLHDSNYCTAPKTYKYNSYTHTHTSVTHTYPCLVQNIYSKELKVKLNPCFN